MVAAPRVTVAHTIEERMSQKPVVGNIVVYRLTAEQAVAINRSRTTSSSIHERISSGHWPRGAQAHMGSTVSAGEEVPLLVARVWPDEYGPGVPGLNGQAFLDGTDTLWVTSAREGEGPGTWSWPEAAPAHVPAPELVQAAEASLSTATTEELLRAESAYRSYCAVAVTGASLPSFQACPVLVRAGWLAVARAFPAEAVPFTEEWWTEAARGGRR